MPDEDAEREHQKKMELDILRHWRAFLAACKQEEMDDVTFLAALSANVGQLLMEEYPEHAEVLLSRLNRQVREELQLRSQQPS